MNRTVHRCVTLTLTLLLGISGAATAGETLAMDPSAVRWTHLAYKAKKFGFSVETKITLDVVDSAQAAGDLVKPEKGDALSARGAELVVLTLHDKVLGRVAETDLWLEPADGTVLQRVKVYPGKKGRYKAYRFAAEGLHIIRREPGRGQDALAPDLWPKTSESWKAYRSGAVAGHHIADPSALFYLVGAGALQKPGDVVKVPIYSNDGPLLVELRALDTTSFKVDYKERSGSGERRVNKTVGVLRVTMQGEPLDPSAGEGRIELMGLEGNVEMLVDPALGLPVAVRGKAPIVGKVTVSVGRVTLR